MLTTPYVLSCVQPQYCSLLLDFSKQNIILLVIFLMCAICIISHGICALKGKYRITFEFCLQIQFLKSYQCYHITCECRYQKKPISQEMFVLKNLHELIEFQCINLLFFLWKKFHKNAFLQSVCFLKTNQILKTQHSPNSF